MSRYFFDLVEDGVEFRDEEGQDLPDPVTARGCAIQGIRGILSAAILEGQLPLSGRVHIRDAGGSEVMSLAYGDAVAISR